MLKNEFNWLQQGSFSKNHQSTGPNESQKVDVVSRWSDLSLKIGQLYFAVHVKIARYGKHLLCLESLLLCNDVGRRD